MSSTFVGSSNYRTTSRGTLNTATTATTHCNWL